MSEPRFKFGDVVQTEIEGNPFGLAVIVKHSPYPGDGSEGYEVLFESESKRSNPEIGWIAGDEVKAVPSIDADRIAAEIMQNIETNRPQYTRSDAMKIAELLGRQDVSDALFRWFSTKGD